MFFLRSDLSDRLNLSRDEGEKWIVNLIRETRMGADAKIDLEKASELDITSLTSALILNYFTSHLNRMLSRLTANRSLFTNP